jgi:hypothetical protein
MWSLQKCTMIERIDRLEGKQEREKIEEEEEEGGMEGMEGVIKKKLEAWLAIFSVQHTEQERASSLVISPPCH